ncbi:Xaa-Pro dipeptidase [Trichinella spiralis]|uniref:Xaa-Pro dipeptidase n=2 Tax=Trichinella spiralis TaxID=6334 RepID=A0A0V1BID8_TRISP|nr:Xaa-Pro dipeptidase [Trichinella spiralis]KRY36933.1 Xaa-Pro dipeptidase [Trichinella spiralis]
MESSAKLMHFDAPDVTLKIFQENRARLLRELKKVVTNPATFILMEGGKVVNHHTTDLVEGDSMVFRQESYFFWTFGVKEPGFYGAISVQTGETYLFAPEVESRRSIWLGKIPSLEETKRQYGVTEVFYDDRIAEKLSTLGCLSVLTLTGQNTDSELDLVEPDVNLTRFHVNNKILYPIITECRVFKTDRELEFIRYACKVTCQAHIQTMCCCEVDMSELQLESLFRFFASFYGKCRHIAYTCIAASGPNAAILHYGHAGKPNDRIMKIGDLCVMDMGAEFSSYASDVTSTFPISGQFLPKQCKIYEAVLDANRAIISKAKPEESWIVLHMTAQKIILKHLIQAGLLQGDLESMIDVSVGSVFMPHGVGHFLGLDVHDVGGYLKGVRSFEDKKYSILRTTRVLKPRMVITVEPGCYFIETLINQALSDRVKSEYLVKSVIDDYRELVGGVRIEDVILITEDGCENLTPLPRTVEEIQACVGSKKVIPLAGDSAET